MRRKPGRKTVVLLLTGSVFILSGAFVVPALYPRAVNIYEKIRVLNQIISIVNENYVEPVDWDVVMDGAFRGLLEELDPHSSYIPRDRLEAINEQFHGKFEGIGIEFDILGGYVTVISPVAGSPSDRAGLLPGDQIVKINGKDAFKITNEEVFQKLRGRKGTAVTVTIRRPGVEDPFDVEIIRDEIPIYSVIATFMLDDRTGYIRLGRFSASTAREVREAVDRLMSQGMTQLIFDLRWNSGGYLEQAVEVADYFITTRDTLVYTLGRKPEANEVYLADPAVGYSDFALIVLIDRGSASASEIVAGAVQDLDRGLVLGETSFGKGLVQRQWPLRDDSAVRVTIARYYTPSGRLIQRPYENGVHQYYQELAQEDREVLLDSLRASAPSYRTRLGRKVYGGGGITPDVFVAPRRLSQATRNVLRHPQRFTFNWGMEFASKRRTEWHSVDDFKTSFQITPAYLEDFESYVTDHGVALDREALEGDSDYVKTVLKAEIAGAIWGKDAYHGILALGDRQVIAARQHFDQAREFLVHP
ncbi:MAG: S41 family peptidase [Fidelibacterota bacterium]